jgi:hypothetical protein
MVGVAFIVTVAITLHPPTFVYMISEVPTETPVTTPVEDTVATDGVALDHGVVPFGVPDPVSAVVVPSQALNVPEIVGFA